MKKILLLSLIFISTSAGTQVDKITFKSPDNFFTMDYPDHWELKKNGTEEFIFKDRFVDLGSFVVKQIHTSELAADYESYKERLLDRYMGARVKKLGYENFVEFEERVTQGGNEAIRYHWITGNDNYVVKLNYDILFDLRTKEEVLNEQKLVFKTIESLKINE